MKEYQRKRMWRERESGKKMMRCNVLILQFILNKRKTEEESSGLGNGRKKSAHSTHVIVIPFATG